MILLSIPKEVLQSIILDWIGTLGGVVRLDSAYSAVKVDHQGSLRSIFLQKSFKFIHKDSTSRQALSRLCAWLMSRQASLRHIEFNQNGRGKPVLQEWEELVRWCGAGLTSIHVHSRKANTKLFFIWIRLYCPNIQELLVDYIDGSMGPVLNIVENCADSLVSLALINCLEQTDDFANLTQFCFRLRELRLHSSNVGEFEQFIPLIRRCPNLTYLHIENGDISEVVTFTIGECCPLLQRLQMNYLCGVDEQSLLRIAQGCSSLQRLQLIDCMDYFTEMFIDILCAMPHLLSLQIARSALQEEILLEVVMRKSAPSLMVLATGTSFTYSGFKEFTIACPNLKGLEFYDSLLTYEDQILVTDDGRTNLLFEHCRELRHLILLVHDDEGEMSAFVLESVAACCPDLSTLEIVAGADYDSSALQSFLDKCPQLRTLVVTDSHIRSIIKTPLCNPSLLITDCTIPLE